MCENEKVILITGGTSGIGLSTALKLNTLGTKVVVTGRSIEKLHAIKKEYDIDTFYLDISESDEIGNHISEFVNKYKKIDTLINCAGIGVFGKIDQIKDIDIKECITTNLTGTILISKYVSQIMKKQGHGHIISIESIAADKGFQYGGIYAATKAGLSMFNSVMWMELRTENIRVTSIKPGLVNTKIVENIEKNPDLIYCLSTNDVVDAIVFALNQPASCNVSEITLRPFEMKGQTLFNNLLEKKYNI